MRIALSTFFIATIVPAFLLVPLSDIISGLAPLAILRFPILLFAAAIALWFSSTQKPALRLSLLLLSISGFGALSCIWSINLEVSLERALLNIAVACFLITYAIAFSSANQLRILIALSVGVTITLTLGIVFGVFFNSSQIFFQGNFRGGFSNSNSLALMIIIYTVPLCLAYFAQGGFGRKTLWALVLLAAIGILVLTRSRASLLALAAAIAFFVLTRRQITVRLLIVISTAATVIYLSYDILDFFAGKYSNISLGALDTRLIPWKLHLAAIWEQPILGYGIGVNPVNFKEISDFARDTEKGSSLISIPEELGVPFFIAFVIASIALLLGPIRRLIEGIKHRTAPPLSILPVIVVFSSMTHGLFEAWIFTFGNISALFLWMCLAFIFRLDLEMGRVGKRRGRSLT